MWERVRCLRTASWFVKTVQSRDNMAKQSLSGEAVLEQVQRAAAAGESLVHRSWDGPVGAAIDFVIHGDDRAAFQLVSDIAQGSDPALDAFVADAFLHALMFWHGDKVQDRVDEACARSARFAAVCEQWRATAPEDLDAAFGDIDGHFETGTDFGDELDGFEEYRQREEAEVMKRMLATVPSDGGDTETFDILADGWFRQAMFDTSRHDDDCVATRGKTDADEWENFAAGYAEGGESR
jgi:hypothetical protein